MDNAAIWVVGSVASLMVRLHWLGSQACDNLSLNAPRATISDRRVHLTVMVKGAASCRKFIRHLTPTRPERRERVPRLHKRHAIFSRVGDGNP